MKRSYKPNNNRFYLYCNFAECASFMANLSAYDSQYPRPLPHKQKVV
ncbi:hypothetical protein HMPREF3156_00863 [Neisseria sp. HMSC06F02]|nr:hypothetical protein HMPREF3156_00863 [Neisseria sp. HMSC06F02]